MTTDTDIARLQAGNAEDGQYERVALGCLLLHPPALDQVRPWLAADDFTWPVHRAVYTAAQTLREQGEPVDPTAVLAELRRQQYPDGERLPGYLAHVVEQAPVPLSATYYSKIVLERAVRRDLTAAGMRLQQIGERGAGSPDDLYEQMDVALRKAQDMRGRWDVADAPRRARDDAGVQVRDGQLYGVPAAADGSVPIRQAGRDHGGTYDYGDAL